MNRPNDDIERSLRRYFEEFDDHYDDDAPSLRTWGKIEECIQPKPMQVSFKTVLIASLLLLISTSSGSYFIPNKLNECTTWIQKEKKVTVLSMISDKKREDVVQAIDNQKITIRNFVPINSLSQSRKLRKSNWLQQNSAQMNVDSFNSIINVQQQFLSLPNGESQNLQLSLLSTKGYKPFLSQVAKPYVSFPASLPIFGKKAMPSHLAWILSVQPFQTFQYLTNNISTTDFQLAALYIPSILNKKRMGWEVAIGIEKKRNKQNSWRVLGLYRSLPQFIHYQISTSEFLVKETGLNQVNVERVTVDVNEHSTLQSLGIEVDYIHKFSPKLYISGGFSGATQWQNTSLSQAGLRASIGWTYALNPHHTFWVEPTYTYYLNKTTDNRKVIQFQPYTIGVKMGLQLHK